MGLGADDLLHLSHVGLPVVKRPIRSLCRRRRSTARSTADPATRAPVDRRLEGVDRLDGVGRREQDVRARVGRPLDELVPAPRR
jgi:hypothetical protein